MEYAAQVGRSPAVLAEIRTADTRISDTWTIAPALGWGLLLLVMALVVADSGLDALTRLLTEPPPVAAGPAFGSPGQEDVMPDLPARPDLTPAPRPPAAGGVGGGGSGVAPLSVPGKTVEDVCVEPLGATSGCKRWAMDGFYGQLAAGEGGVAKRVARVSFYGDSVSATDALPGRVRARLQDVFGDGGPGFIHAVQPHRFNHTEAVKRTSSGSWKTWGISLSNVPDHLYGVGNSTAEGAGQIRMSPKTPSGKISKVDVYYLAQPGGGTAEVKVGEATATIDTAAPQKAARFQSLSVPDGQHDVTLASVRGKIRLFGMALERDAGIVVDNMALVSCNAKSMLVNLSDHWKNQLAHRDADLIVIMLGTNEAQWLAGATAMAEYEKTWEAVLAPIRAARPQASCLVMSPLDQAEEVDGKVVSRRGVPKMVAAQRQAAQAAGCAYWDTFTWMGGTGAALRWNQKGWLGSDFQHMSRRGTARVADGLADALFSGYKAYKGR